MKTFLCGVSGFILVFLFAGTTALAQQESPAEYIESIETETDTGGAADEADAAVAQADVPQEDSVAGLDDEERQRIEQIVVTARKRAELLEETPISVTALGETRPAGIQHHAAEPDHRTGTQPAIRFRRRHLQHRARLHSRHRDQRHDHDQTNPAWASTSTGSTWHVPRAASWMSWTWRNSRSCADRREPFSGKIPPAARSTSPQ